MFPLLKGLANISPKKRSLSNAEVNHVQDQVVSRLKNQFDVEIR